MKIVIIGSGNVATVLGRLIKKAGHDIVQIASRNAGTVKLLGDEMGCAFTTNFSEIQKVADLYLVAMSDAALNGLPETFKLNDQLIVHTAGAVSKDVLKKISSKYGIMYPMQSLRKEENIPDLKIPMLVEGCDAITLRLILAFAQTISPIVQQSSEEERLKMHVAAVVVNNFTNHLYALAEDYCKKEHVDFKMLYPLIAASAERVQLRSPGAMQTGPAVRKDILTLEKHLRILQQHQPLRSIYLKMTDSIMKMENS